MENKGQLLGIMYKKEAVHEDSTDWKWVDFACLESETYPETFTFVYVARIKGQLCRGAMRQNCNIPQDKDALLKYMWSDYKEDAFSADSDAGDSMEWEIKFWFKDHCKSVIDALPVPLRDEIYMQQALLEI
jgi:hypothetical protein